MFCYFFSSAEMMRIRLGWCHISPDGSTSRGHGKWVLYTREIEKILEESVRAKKLRGVRIHTWWWIELQETPDGPIIERRIDD